MTETPPVVRAPEIDIPGVIWLNTAVPLSLNALRGRLVILDFWTFCCINCMHLLPSLARVEAAFPAEIVVIGVHSPKFTAERDPRNVAAAVRRYGIRHPVAHDPEFRIWQEYAVRAWPTLVFIGPEGRIIGRHSGEADPDRLVEAVGGALARFRAEGTLRPGAIAIDGEDEVEPVAVPGRLRFPGKIKRVPGRAKLWAVADAGHHQIALLADDGSERARYGSGAPGLADGAAADAAFDAPQGLAANGEVLFVADTGNHALRRIDLTTGRVTTLAGIGRRGPALRGPAPARASALASPWDVEVLPGGRLAFANAGTHQLGLLDPAAGTVAALAGSGAEAILDGPAGEAALAQPSGLAVAPDGSRLYFADSETSAIRGLALGPPPRVETLIGAGLFEFGHVNGPLAMARLQHPLGLACWEGRIAVADSYNNAIRIIDLGRGRLDDLDPGSFLCLDPVCLPLAEPAGIAAAGKDRLLVVDTNNHRILDYDIAARRYRTWAS